MGEVKQKNYMMKERITFQLDQDNYMKRERIKPKECLKMVDKRFKDKLRIC